MSGHRNRSDIKKAPNLWKPFRTEGRIIVFNKYSAFFIRTLPSNFGVFKNDAPFQDALLQYSTHSS